MVGQLHKGLQIVLPVWSASRAMAWRLFRPRTPRLLRPPLRAAFLYLRKSRKAKDNRQDKLRLNQCQLTVLILLLSLSCERTGSQNPMR
jgi:hypothetical protein